MKVPLVALDASSTAMPSSVAANLAPGVGHCYPASRGLQRPRPGREEIREPMRCTFKI